MRIFSRIRFARLLRVGCADFCSVVVTAFVCLWGWDLFFEGKIDDGGSNLCVLVLNNIGGREVVGGAVAKCVPCFDGVIIMIMRPIIPCLLDKRMGPPNGHSH